MQLLLRATEELEQTYLINGARRKVLFQIYDSTAFGTAAFFAKHIKSDKHDASHARGHHQQHCLPHPLVYTFGVCSPGKCICSAFIYFIDRLLDGLLDSGSEFRAFCVWSVSIQLQRHMCGAVVNVVDELLPGRVG